MSNVIGSVQSRWRMLASRLPGGERTLAGIIVGLVVLLVRLAYLFAYKSSPFYHVPVIDADFHHRWALRILKGDWLSIEQGDVLYKAPLYPYFLALIYQFTGTSLTAVRLVQAVLGSGSAVLILLLGERFFARRVGVIASLLYGLYFVSIFFDVEMEIPVLAVFLTLLSLTLLTGSGRARSLVGSGVALGLSALALPSNLLLLPLWGTIAWKRCSWQKATLVLIAAVLTVAPCTMRNLVIGHHFVPVSANAGLNFFIGNNPDYDITVSMPPGMAWTRFNAEANPSDGSPSNVAADRYWMQRSWKGIAEAPSEWVSLLGKKLVLYFMSYEITRNRDIYYAWDESPLSKLPFLTLTVILPLGLLGLGLAVLRREKHAGIASTLLLLAIPCVAFFVVSRYRLPSVALWSIYAAYALSWLYDTIRRRRLAAGGPALAVVVALAVFVNLKLFVSPQTAWRPHVSQGVIYRSLHKPAAAITHFRKALSLMQGDDDWVRYTRADVANKIGMLYGRMGKPDSARLYLDTALGLVHDFNNAWYNRTLACMELNDDLCAFASACWARCSGNRQQNMDELVLTTLHRAQPDDSLALGIVSSCTEQAVRTPIYNFVAMHKVSQGDTFSALALLEETIARDTADILTLANLAHLGARDMGRIPEKQRSREQERLVHIALREAQKGETVSATSLLGQASLLGINPTILTHLGAANAKLGKTEHARRYLQRALQLDPGFEAAHRILAMLDSSTKQPGH